MPEPKRLSDVRLVEIENKKHFHRHNGLVITELLGHIAAMEEGDKHKTAVLFEAKDEANSFRCVVNAAVAWRRSLRTAKDVTYCENMLIQATDNLEGGDADVRSTVQGNVAKPAACDAVGLEVCRKMFPVLFDMKATVEEKEAARVTMLEALDRDFLFDKLDTANARIAKLEGLLRKAKTDMGLCGRHVFLVARIAAELGDAGK